MTPGFRMRKTAAMVLLLFAGGAAVLAAPGAGATVAPSGLSLGVDITSQGLAGGTFCQGGVTFNLTIVNSGSSPVTVTSVSAPNYQQEGGSLNGSPAPGTVLPPGTSTFPHIQSDSGPSIPCPQGPVAPAPLVLTVTTSAGSATWNQSVSDPQVVTSTPPPLSTIYLVGSFDVANCSQYYFQYGTTTSYGQQAGLSNTGCPNDGTATQDIYDTLSPAGLQPGTAYYYRLVVIQADGTALYGQGQTFETSGTPLPIGAVGGLGMGALAGATLLVTQRRRRRRAA